MLSRWWTVDDLIVYKLADEKYLLVPNAANIDKDYAWMHEHVKGDVTLQNISDEVGQLAIQGPKAESILQKLTDIDLSKLVSIILRKMQLWMELQMFLYPVQVTQGKMDSNYT